MSTTRTKKIVTVGDVRDAKRLADAKAADKADKDRQQIEWENALLKEYPEIGYTMVGGKRKFYAYIYGPDASPFSRTDIEKVVAAVNAVDTLGAIAAKPFIAKLK